MLKECLQALINAIVKYNTDGNLADIEIGKFRIEGGSIVLNGESQVTVQFRKPFASFPVLTVTAIDNPLLKQSFTVSEKKTDSFIISNVEHTPVRFDYIAIGRKSS